jgi:hypothetical protein
MAVVENMKKTMITLAGTFDNLGEQTARVAELKPQIDSAHQVTVSLAFPPRILIVILCRSNISARNSGLTN